MALTPLPPVIDTTGVSVKSNPLSKICNSLKDPLIAKKPVAPLPTGSVMFNSGGFITSKSNPGEDTSTLSSLPV